MYLRYRFVFYSLVVIIPILFAGVLALMMPQATAQIGPPPVSCQIVGEGQLPVGDVFRGDVTGHVGPLDPVTATGTWEHFTPWRGGQIGPTCPSQDVNRDRICTTLEREGLGSSLPPMCAVARQNLALNCVRDHLDGVVFNIFCPDFVGGATEFFGSGLWNTEPVFFIVFARDRGVFGGGPVADQYFITIHTGPNRTGDLVYVQGASAFTHIFGDITYILP